MHKFKIDEEFKSLIPPLTSEEFQQLEQNIISEGCIDTLIIWNETLIDGHNRYEICTRNNIHFDIKEMRFNSKEEVKEWIIRHQFGRRNLSPFQRSELALQLKPLIQARAKKNLSAGGGDKKSEKVKSGYQNTDKAISKKIDTNKELAQIAGVSHDTIFKVEQIQKHAPEEIKQKVQSGEMSIRQGYKAVKRKEDAKSAEMSKQEIKVKEVEKEQKKESGPQPETQQESIFNLSYFQGVVNCFLKEINPLSFSQILIRQMDIEIKTEYVNELERISDWINKVKQNIKNNMEG